MVIKNDCFIKLRLYEYLHQVMEANIDCTKSIKLVHKNF